MSAASLQRTRYCRSVPSAAPTPASTGRGAVVLALWAVAAVVAWRVGSRALQWLHVVVGAALVLGAVSMARIFGKPWYYLTLWAWGITAVMLGAIAWSGVALVGAARRSGGGGVVGDGGVVRRCPGARGSPQRGGAGTGRPHRGRGGSGRRRC